MPAKQAIRSFRNRVASIAGKPCSHIVPAKVGMQMLTVYHL
ncbi:hypothetical protein AK973_5708 [Pseudomonas brassicacearum]|nr:hypothetical protein AK973_5708 [Pseudomonas brassicacearum]